ncbi:Hypothetical protein CpMEX30_0091 [Corynebacterium pseudotuberculosis]|nr:Hypothetical protein CpE19_0090 [Corynebacterium pseudotuberculosis]APQ53211.1 Hypothetical protein CpMEX30_0091 [Corynebacterium pseudotuberculosis]APQ55266.1 Hypothetical protein CpMEX31_0091 [Corynebacterium pseudotuberculosis]ATB60989.1 Hypothetical protein BFF96_0094 [Corynebacterium pseudotuberculosis]ATV78856.1 Hypothetical protein BFF97_00085 [Corynebacterium pseudotuberculosis]
MELAEGAIRLQGAIFPWSFACQKQKAVYFLEGIRASG